MILSMPGSVLSMTVYEIDNSSNTSREESKEKKSINESSPSNDNSESIDHYDESLHGRGDQEHDYLNVIGYVTTYAEENYAMQ